MREMTSRKRGKASADHNGSNQLKSCPGPTAFAAGPVSLLNLRKIPKMMFLCHILSRNYWNVFYNVVAENPHTLHKEKTL